ncbi:MAG: hypothetical protein K0M60_03825 [Hydrogenophaga sp.]|uniref:hypothetical protein n=1 Tax=Ciceribacter sp. T2.26MG-112.2 TaxID=3137154 RepID=UPI0012B6A7F1|nr:hypothetical protein [Ciceribacter naphthalenivorans]MBW8298710.1 hypothetical protein [Hydrogenophaga sp.]
MTTSRARAANEPSDFRKIYRPFPPYPTLKCVGQPLFRNQYARDYACILDLDPEVISWKCMPAAIVNDSNAARPRWWHVDFAVETSTEALLVDIWQTTTGGPTWLPRVAERMGYRLQNLSLHEIDPILLQNAKDLMRYVGSEVPLGDRVRVLAALDEIGSLTFAESLSVIRESMPMHSIVALIISGILEVDLSLALLGPDSVVRRASK